MSWNKTSKKYNAQNLHYTKIVKINAQYILLKCEMCVLCIGLWMFYFVQFFIYLSYAMVSICIPDNISKFHIRGLCEWFFGVVIVVVVKFCGRPILSIYKSLIVYGTDKNVSLVGWWTMIYTGYIGFLGYDILK